MPKLTGDLEQIKTGNFTFSATRIDNLGSEGYTLVTIACDASGSVSSYKTELEKCLAEIVKACRNSPRADSLMLRLVTFNGNETEEHGFKLLQECNPDDYLNRINPNGNTALFDACYNSIEATNAYAKSLIDKKYSANGIFFCITDGDDNSSTYTPLKVKNALQRSVSGEVMESMVSVLIGVGDNTTVQQYLDRFHDDAEFTQFVPIGSANDKTLAKLAAFVSKSISSQSQSLGTGGPSKQISLTF
jgi:uncharacterized protein YegL